MKALLAGLYAHFVVSDFNDTLTGGLFRGTVPAQALEPYGRVFEVSDIPEYTFDTVHEEFLIQVDIFGPELDLPDLYEEQKKCFDDCRFTMDGHRLVSFVREMSRPMVDEDGVWNHRMTQYRVRTEKTS